MTERRVVLAGWICAWVVLVAAASGQEGEKVPPQPAEPVSLFPVKEDGKFGYIDVTGKTIIPPQFEAAGSFSDGMAQVNVGSHNAYIDMTGKVVFQVDVEFNVAGEFSEGMAVVGRHGPGDFMQETLGFMDKTGKVVIPVQFEEAGPFIDGLARVSKDFKRGYIDKKGEFVIKPEYELAADFSEGLARVGMSVDGLPREHFIDRIGKRAIEPEFRFIDDFHEGLARVWVGENKGFIDRTGAVVIAPQPFNSVGHFADGMAQVQTGGPMGAGGKLGFMDRTGKVVVEPRYQFAEQFSEGLCAVFIDEKYGYIDRAGQVVIEPLFGTAGPFTSGLAAVWSDQGMRYIDKTGKAVWPAPK